MTDAPTDAEMEQVAEEELAAALSLSWRALAGNLPWGDTFQGFGPSGRELEIERSYVWAEREGGDILCEVVVYAPAAYEKGARRRQLIRAAI